MIAEIIFSAANGNKIWVTHVRIVAQNMMCFEPKRSVSGMTNNADRA
jgi:hypothetical protein